MKKSSKLTILFLCVVLSVVAVSLALTSNATEGMGAAIFNADFRADSAEAVNKTDRVGGLVASEWNSPTYVLDSTLGKYVLATNGLSAANEASAVSYNIESLYATMANGFTVETYVWMDTQANDSGVHTILGARAIGQGFSIDEFGKTSSGWDAKKGTKSAFLFVTKASDAYNFCWTTSVTGSTLPTRTDSDGDGYVLPHNQWLHIVGTASKTHMAIYVNGELWTEIDRSAAADFVFWGQGASTNATKSFYLGANASSAMTGDQTMNGAKVKMAYTRIYSGAATTAQVSSLYAAANSNAPVATAGPTATPIPDAAIGSSRAFDLEISATEYTDRIGGANTTFELIAGTAPSIVYNSEIEKNVLSFAADSRLKVGNIDFSAYTEMTISMYVYLPANGETNDLISMGIENNVNIVDFDNEGNRCTYFGSGKNDDSGDSDVVKTNGNLERGKWNHVVVTATGTEQHIYFNGVLVASGTFATKLHEGSQTDTIYLGTVNPGRSGEMLVADVQVFGQAASAADVLLLQAAQLPITGDSGLNMYVIIAAVAAVAVAGIYVVKRKKSAC